MWIKKAAVILAVGFFAGIGAGFVVFEYVADMMQTAGGNLNDD